MGQEFEAVLPSPLRNPQYGLRDYSVGILSLYTLELGRSFVIRNPSQNLGSLLVQLSWTDLFLGLGDCAWSGG